MCGIAGVVSFNSNSEEKIGLVEAAITKLHKRGPDHTSTYTHKNVSFGHARLSIIDTSNAAHQPFTDASGRFTIVFNGEFFNFKEHRAYVESKGITLKSESDTEVLLYLYIIDGEQCLSKINGFFAFAIHDKESNSVFIARDRYGIKPLYYFLNDDYFCFASELKALVEFGFKKEIDNASLLTYFHLNYIPAPHSIYAGVKKLEQGNCLLINGKDISKKEYYQIPQMDETGKVMSYEEAKKELYRLMDESVQLRMIADVPLGTFLSGGIDSSVITALAALQTKHLKTFSIGFADEPMFDETSFAKLVAKKYQTEHTVFSLKNKDLFEHLHDVLDYMDEPFADSSALNVFILSKETRKHVTVALSGDGADEIFAGYNKHEAERRARLQNFSNSLIKNVQPVIGLFPKSRNSKIGNTFRKLEKFSKGLSLDAADRYWRWAGFMDDAELMQYIRPYLANHDSIHEYRDRKNLLTNGINNTDFNSILRADMKMVLEGDMLVKADRMSMANSLEVRVPFLDYRVVNLAFSLPSEYKIDAFQRKKIVKETFSHLLPPELMNRGKQGFEVPLLKWFRTELKSTITNDLLKDNFITSQNIFNVEETFNLKQQLFSNSPNDAVAKTWAMIVFQSWYKKNMI
jgi:asparagine synthase (glutamine-hydrolysing)